jgi:hypothetical protein
MANSIKGEVAFQVEGATWKASFSVNALCELEEALGLPVNEIGKIMTANMSMKHLRAVFWATLLDHHGVDIAEAGRIMGLIGIGTAAQVVGDAFTLAFPQEDAKATARPQKAARAGNG